MPVIHGQHENALAASVRLEVRDGGANVDYGWDFDRPMVSDHQPYQIAGHPAQPRPPCKFHNYWTVRTPPAAVACSPLRSIVPTPRSRSSLVSSTPIATIR